MTLNLRLKTIDLMDVPEERLELSRDNSQRLLRPQRLPISPSGHFEVLDCKVIKQLTSLITTSCDNKAANIIVSVAMLKINVKIYES